METLNVPTPAYHVPALLHEAVDLLVTDPEGVYVDATFGGGGHSRAILDRLGPKGRLFSFDRDLDAYENRLDDPRFTFVHSNFRYIENFIRFYGFEKIDGILADLGVSFHHFDTAERGFSFRQDSPLDMRMNRQGEITAETLLQQLTEDELTGLFKAYADLKRPKDVARAIIKKRQEKAIATTFELKDAITPVLDPRQEKKELAQAFQAIRIAVNGEMEDLQRFLLTAGHILKEKGRLAVLTYHSGEDRMVKNFMKSGNIEGNIEKDFYGNISSEWKLLTRKPIEPSAEEIEANPRSRSARLRVAEFVG